MSIKNQEGRDIIDTGCRGGADYNNTVQNLKDRYDLPRETCRIVFQQFLQHAMEMTAAEGIGKTITLLQKTLATLKECSSFTVETLYTIIMELKMPDIMFQHWMEETSIKKQPPPATDLVDSLRRYRMRFTGRQPQHKTTPRPPTPPFKRKTFKTSSFPAQITRECGLCRNRPHPYACLNFRDQSVEDRNNTA